MEHFMANITDMVTELVRTHQEADAEKMKIFALKQEVVGICPNCGSRIVKGRCGAYCEKKSGVQFKFIMEFPKKKFIGRKKE